MRTYNYLANERARELVELYADKEREMLKVIARGLTDQTEPIEISNQLASIINKYKRITQSVIAIIFADEEKKAVKDGQKDTIDEDTPITLSDANTLIRNELTQALQETERIDNRWLSQAMQKYQISYNRVTTPNLRYTSEQILNQELSGLAKFGIPYREAMGAGLSKDYKIENVLNRNIMYLANKTNNKINMQNFNKSSAKFIETSSHPTARTWNKYMKHAYEDHSSWQGEVFYSQNEEPIEGYREFESTCGYGELLGIGGINCYHQFKLNYTGKSAYTQYDHEEVKEQYELSQQQRGYERKIRELKSARVVWQEAGNKDRAEMYTREIRNATNRLRRFCDENNLKYYNWRTQI